MGVSLSKGGNVSLAKATTDAATAAGNTPEQAAAKAAALALVTVGLGWDARTTDGAKFDLDASAIATGENKKAVADDHFVFYNNRKTPGGEIEHTGDNRTGEGAGDDEALKVNLAALSPQVTSIFFPVTINDAETNGQSFGQVRNAYIRVVDASDGTELARYDLSEDASTETGMVFGELYRSGADWKFRAIGQGYGSGLKGIAADYGVNV